MIEQARKGSTRAVLLHAAIAERLGLNATDHKCADLLSLESGVCTPGRMAELTGLSTGAITGVLDRLERMGLVVREADPHDRRRTLVRLAAGRQPNWEKILLPLANGMERVCSKYTVEQLQLILQFMRELEETAVHAAEEVRKQNHAKPAR